MHAYQYANPQQTAIIRDDGLSFPIAPGNAEYDLFVIERDAGATVQAATPMTAPFVPDFGADADDDPTFRTKAQQAVNDLRTYLGLASPSAAQSAAALKLLIRVVLFLLRRSL